MSAAAVASAKPTLLLESETCGRCGGSGQHSFNLMHGSVCYGCGGRGVRLTKRGKVAQAFLNSLRKLPISELKAGDKILSEGFSAGSFTEPSKWCVIQSVHFGKGSDFGYVSPPETAALACHRIETDYGSFVGFDATSTYRKAFTRGELLAQQNQALAYQATLGKNGKPLKATKLEPA